MCGIAGQIAFSETGSSFLDSVNDAISCLHKRGPDAQGIFRHQRVALAQTRLAIIDTSDAAVQPMQDATGRYTIIFNGEFFNYREHRQLVLDKGFHLKSTSDTEVLLYLYILEGEKCLQRVNGFFALAIYDREEQTVFIARDRMGVKPLLMYLDHDRMAFASEMKAMVAMRIPKILDTTSLFTYLQLGYIPGPYSIFSNVRKMTPGHYLKIDVRKGPGELQSSGYDSGEATGSRPYYSIRQGATELSYPQQQEKIVELMDAAVERRLVSDVPLGCFLSGGIDSSVVSALAARHTKHLKTFSIGFRDEPLFDETKYANLVAKKIGSDHTVFSLTTDDLYEHLHDVLDYLDEPFADSSALNVHILSRHTRKAVTVALSGDGADELFGGYNKHAAELRIRNRGLANPVIRMMEPLWDALPKSRNSNWGNKVRQLKKFSEGLKLDVQQRYWLWASTGNEKRSGKMLGKEVADSPEYRQRKAQLLSSLTPNGDMNDVFMTDMHLVLVNDMLTKVDLMSMANSLEVRTPFLDYTIVDFAFSLPVQSKIDSQGRKKIIRDAFRHLLPEELYTRGKQGFEVPLLKWFQTELKPAIMNDLLSEEMIRNQGIFQYGEIQKVLSRLYSNSPGDAVAQTWGLIVFQHWWKKYLD